MPVARVPEDGGAVGGKLDSYLMSPARIKVDEEQADIVGFVVVELLIIELRILGALGKLGHHFDDVVETALMSMIWGAELKTMLPKLHSENYEGMSLIRPLYLVREDDVIAWARYNELRFLQCACRFTENDTAANGAGHGARGKTKALVRQLREMEPKADWNIFQSLHRANLNMLPGWSKDGVAHSFLEDYDARK